MLWGSLCARVFVRAVAKFKTCCDDYWKKTTHTHELGSLEWLVNYLLLNVAGVETKQNIYLIKINPTWLKREKKLPRMYDIISCRKNRATLTLVIKNKSFDDAKNLFWGFG